MGKEQNTQPRPGSTETKKTSEQGRQPGDRQQTATEENADISQVDEQEGDMDNGELGGNFDAGSQKEKPQ